MNSHLGWPRQSRVEAAKEEDERRRKRTTREIFEEQKPRTCETCHRETSGSRKTKKDLGGETPKST